MKKQLLIYCSAILITSCAEPFPYTVLNYQQVTVAKKAQQDSAFVRMLKPECTLGNFMADAMKCMAEQKFNRKIDAAFINYGGMRSYIPKGDITVGKIYELMPFENVIVLQSIKGDVLLQFLNLIAEKGGWPIAGITMEIKNAEAKNILINNLPIDIKATYVIANTDYLANGGDNCVMLSKLPQVTASYVFRDALIEYVENQTKQGKAISAKLEKRIVEYE